MNCKECNGSGVLVPGGIDKHAVECPHCEGEGREQEDETSS
ncbi:hypothetical protein [Ammoniphilus sp. YIM 78166]|nr:hypothetical protein [Ammoniphilus sp. YIM 78166]